MAFTSGERILPTPGSTHYSPREYQSLVKDPEQNLISFRTLIFDVEESLDFPEDENDEFSKLFPYAADPFKEWRNTEILEKLVNDAKKILSGQYTEDFFNSAVALIADYLYHANTKIDLFQEIMDKKDSQIRRLKYRPKKEETLEELDSIAKEIISFSYLSNYCKREIEKSRRQIAISIKAYRHLQQIVINF